MKIVRSNQVWATDITYTAVEKGRAFVIAIIDLFSRKVLSHSVVNTMDAFHCVDVLKNALQRYGKPDIFNSDQGSQFTSKEFVNVLKEAKVKISMDGRGRCLDNAKMGRFWWALKYENIHLSDYQSLRQLRFGMQNYINFYNAKRIHSALNWKTPDMVYDLSCNRQSTFYGKQESLHLSF